LVSIPVGKNRPILPIYDTETTVFGEISCSTIASKLFSHRQTRVRREVGDVGSAHARIVGRKDVGVDRLPGVGVPVEFEDPVVGRSSD